jgi:hypothetical protein
LDFSKYLSYHRGLVHSVGSFSFNPTLEYTLYVVQMFHQ